MNKYTSTLKRYHRLKNIAAIVAGLLGAMLGMYCMRLVPSIYAAYALALPIAGAVLAFAGVWLFF
jgi:VIT1/CCC1 family predicted Fe2+/Mn2+ transporter